MASLGRREAHVPFRQTKLTAALKDALGGNSRSVMIACVWPEERHAEESASTPRFASRVRLLQTEPTINERTDPAQQLRRYQKKIEELNETFLIEKQNVILCVEEAGDAAKGQQGLDAAAHTRA